MSSSLNSVIRRVSTLEKIAIAGGQFSAIHNGNRIRGKIAEGPYLGTRGFYYIRANLEGKGRRILRVENMSNVREVRSGSVRRSSSSSKKNSRSKRVNNRRSGKVKARKS